ncbi:MAG: hypothetical protein MK101_04575 [Phycisphaerales bacterium]|nr:hypothetical protein [Phycisphaerales bacterium]
MANHGKIDRLKEELARSLRQLPSDANFFVLFFSGGHQALQQDWLSATRASGFATKAAGVGIGGGTDPRGAFQYALTQLNPKPDAIFFMTDGQIPGDTQSVIARLNAQNPRVRIHTVAFGRDARGAALSQIAASNGGQHRDVP